MRARISVSQACGSMTFIFAVTRGLYIAAAHRPPIRSAEQPGLPSKSDASQAPFGDIVGEAPASIFQDQREARPSLQDVVERLGQVMTAGQLGELFAHIDLQFFDH